MAFEKTTRYFARAVLIHGGMRFESPLRTFDVVPGMKCGGALQMFEGHDGLKRTFELVHWSRNRIEHLFLKARDHGTSNRRWATADLGPLLRVTPPKVSVMRTGEVERDLRIHDVGQHLAPVPHDGARRLVTAAFDSQNVHLRPP